MAVDGGGYYGTAGGKAYCTTYSSQPSSSGSKTDSTVNPGGSGGNGEANGQQAGGVGGKGGGVLRLYADTIDVAGQITANGQDGENGSRNKSAGGGGSGGGVLLAGNKVTFSGVISTVGGKAGIVDYDYNQGGDGGEGRIKFLYGSEKSISGTTNGVTTVGLMPPLRISSSTHPDPELIYNDDFDSIGLAWEKPFAGASGYFYRTSRSRYEVATAADTFVDSEMVLIPNEGFNLAGDTPYYFHFVPIDALAAAGTVENQFGIQINHRPPTVGSLSHPVESHWYAAKNVTFQWDSARGDENVRNYYYVFDQYGDTVPTKNDTALLSTQKNLIRPNVESGIWAFHLISTDTQGRLTKKAGHYRVRIGADPGTGTVLGSIVDEDAQSVEGAVVTVNRGLLLPNTPDVSSNATGSFNMASVPAGNWELTVSKTGYVSKTLTIDVTKDQPTTANFTLKKE